VEPPVENYFLNKYRNTGNKKTNEPTNSVSGPKTATLREYVIPTKTGSQYTAKPRQKNVENRKSILTYDGFTYVTWKVRRDNTVLDDLTQSLQCLLLLGGCYRTRRNYPILKDERKKCIELYNPLF